MNTYRPAINRFYGYVGVVLALVLMSLPTLAQNAPATATPTPTPSITFTGQIESLTDGVMVVNGLSVNLQGVAVATLERLIVGRVVTIAGQLEGGVVQIITIRFDDDDDDDDSSSVTPTVTPAPTLTLTPTPTHTGNNDDDRPIIVVEGPVSRVTVNTVVVFNLTFVISDPTQIVNVRVGDFVRIVGNLDFDDDDFDDIFDDDDDDLPVFRVMIVNITIINVIIIDGVRISDDRRSGRPGSPPPPPNRGGRSSRSSRSS